ncbi:hypothetical protein CEXT_328691 [Caerostris extrusa]|uniref:Uncharacterized protein n=1 Tax=Caerostris extrusa TaxID=172846 RepID=A0AAV4SK00_CAEEX|nr:hypothetical protein CEXT_328691 [Caerostris extrusa]
MQEQRKRIECVLTQVYQLFVRSFPFFTALISVCVNTFADSATALRETFYAMWVFFFTIPEKSEEFCLIGLLTFAQTDKENNVQSTKLLIFEALLFFSL